MPMIMQTTYHIHNIVLVVVGFRKQGTHRQHRKSGRAGFNEAGRPEQSSSASNIDNKYLKKGFKLELVARPFMNKKCEQKCTDIAGEISHIVS